MFLLSVPAFAQINSEYNYSVGVRGYNYMQMPKILDQSSDTYLTTYFSSYFLKLNDNQFSYRLSGGYINHDYTFKNLCENCEIANGNLKDFNIKIGFEKNFSYSVIQPYFAFDAGFRTNRFKGMVKDINSQRLNSAATRPDREVLTKKDGLILTPSIGIKVNPTPQLSLFVESNLDFFFAYERQEAVDQDVTNDINLRKYNKTEYLLNPVAVGIQFHLGNKN